MSHSDAGLGLTVFLGRKTDDGPLPKDFRLIFKQRSHLVFSRQLVSLTSTKSPSHPRWNRGPRSRLGNTRLLSQIALVALGLQTRPSMVDVTTQFVDKREEYSNLLT